MTCIQAYNSRSVSCSFRSGSKEGANPAMPHPIQRFAYDVVPPSIRFQELSCKSTQREQEGERESRPSTWLKKSSDFKKPKSPRVFRSFLGERLKKDSFGGRPRKISVGSRPQILSTLPKFLFSPLYSFNSNRKRTSIIIVNFHSSTNTKSTAAKRFVSWTCVQKLYRSLWDFKK